MIRMRTLLLAAALALPTPILAYEARAERPAELNAAERSQYREIFAAIRAERWADAAARLDGMRTGPLHAIARAELYTAKNSPETSLEALSALLSEAPELPQAAQLGRLAQRRGCSPAQPRRCG